MAPARRDPRGAGQAEHLARGGLVLGAAVAQPSVRPGSPADHGAVPAHRAGVGSAGVEVESARQPGHGHRHVPVVRDPGPELPVAAVTPAEEPALGGHRAGLGVQGGEPHHALQADHPHRQGTADRGAVAQVPREAVAPAPDPAGQVEGAGVVGRSRHGAHRRQVGAARPRTPSGIRRGRGAPRRFGPSTRSGRPRPRRRCGSAPRRSTSTGGRARPSG